jgi:hypothetical protein
VVVTGECSLVLLFMEVLYLRVSDPFPPVTYHDHSLCGFLNEALTRFDQVSAPVTLDSDSHNDPQPKMRRATAAAWW